MKRKVLITGCNGFIGKNLINHLQSLSYEVYGIDVNCTDTEHFFRVDINVYEDLQSVFKNVLPELVIHLAARIDISFDMIWEYKTNIVGVQNLIRLTEEIESVKRVVWTSTQLVNTLGNSFIDYDHYDANTVYGASKVIGEQLVKNGIKKKEWVIVRPSTVWGPGMGDHYLGFIKYIESGLYFNVTRKNVYKSFSYIGNTCFQIEKIIASPAKLINKRVFYLSDYHPLELHDWTNKMSLQLNRGKIISLPLLISYLIAYVFLVLKNIGFISKVPISFYNIKNIKTTYINNNDLEQITGELPYSMIDGIKYTIEWYKNES